MAVTLISTPESFTEAVRLIPVLRDRYLSDDPTTYIGDWPDRQAKVIVEVKRNRAARMVAAAAELPAIALMWGDTNTKDAWADALLSSSKPDSPDILTWTVSQNSLPNAIITTINNSLLPYKPGSSGFPVEASTREKLLSFINTTWMPPTWQQKFLTALKGAAEILPATAAPALAKANEQIKNIQGKIEQDVASDAFHNVLAPTNGPDVIPPPIPLKPSFAQSLLSAKNRPYVIMSGGLLLMGLLVLVGHSLKHPQRLNYGR